MAQIIKLKRSLSAGSKPATSDLSIGELAMNVTDGKVFLRKSGSAGDNVKEIVTLDHDGTLSGSLNITGSITASVFVSVFVKLLIYDNIFNLKDSLTTLLTLNPKLDDAAFETTLYP